MAARQTENEGSERSASASKTMKRRGLIAGAAALVASASLLRTSEKVAAIDVNSGTYYRAVDPYSSTNVLWGDASTLPNGYNVDGVVGWAKGTATGVKGTGGSAGGVGVQGFGGGNADGVQGQGTGAYSGTAGFGGGTSGTGAYGQGGGPNGTGVNGVGAGTGPGVHGYSASGTGVYGESNGNAIIGISHAPAGSGYPAIYGFSTGGVGVEGLGTNGVYGNATDPSGSGVWGHHYGGGNGVYGDSNNGRGVYGFTNAGFGVQGISTSLYGVVGRSDTSVAVVGYVIGATNPSAAIVGTGTKGPGVQGQSPGGHGLVGTTDATDGHAGLVGNANKAGGIGLMGIAPGYGTVSVGQAGIFYGNVKIYGGTLSAPVHSAEVMHAGDNTYRLLYSEGVTESWIADYGKAKLVNGNADVKLDPDFAALVHTDDYHVFLTEYGDHNNLFVATLSPSGFTVQAKEPTTVSGVKAPTKAVNTTFGYRVVARRKDIKSERLAKVGAPAAADRPAAMTITEMPVVTAPAVKAPAPVIPPVVAVTPAPPATKPPTTTP